MRSPLRSVVLNLGFAVAAAAVAGCASSKPDDVGVVRLAITAIPADVNCLRLTATGARTVVQQFDVAPGTNASLLVTGLPTGTVVINADAFAAACAMAGDHTTANWISDPQTLNVSTTDIVDLSLVMHRNGRVRIGVDFTDDVTATCMDGIQNGNETGVDCGGSCPKCGGGMNCRTDADCPAGQSCAGFSCRTNPPTCADGIQNGDETGVDCGGATCPKCGPPSCQTDADCPAGSSCFMFSCRVNPPTCADGIQNGDETGVDCGGATCPKCGGTSCRSDADCPAGQACAGFSCRPTFSCALPAGAIAWWRAENNYADVFATHDGTPFGAVSFVPGAVGTAFGFDGVTLGYVDAVAAPDLDVTAGFTIDAWVNLAAVEGTGRIVDKIHAFNDDGYLLDAISGFLRFKAGVSTIGSPDRLSTGTFVHVAGVFDAARTALFVNGALVAEAPSGGAAVPTNGLPLRIGADSDGGSLFPGAIDEPRIFNRGLTNAEVRTLFLQATNCP
ncbi:MAG TPA: LamG domain-containing protein [Polyangia bacterium]|jgi:hypothetical protein